MSLKHTKDRVIVSVNMVSKNTYRFNNGQILTLFPNTNNFDRRYSQPVNGIVISADDIPISSEVLIEHNSTHPTNEITEYKSDNPNIKYFSVPKLECYVWREVAAEEYVKYGNEGVQKMIAEKFAWQPTKYYAIGELVFKPYKGRITNVEPEVIKNTLLIKTGEFKNKIVRTVRNGHYIIIFQDTNGKPNEILLTFHNSDEKDISFRIPQEGERLPIDEINRITNYAKQEIVAVDENLTEQYLNGELQTGLKPLKQQPEILTYAN